jgi:hypothetical protein
MNLQRPLVRGVLAVCLLLAGASVARAQATRTWVSGVGDDANPCSRTAPCKTFAGAISKTAAGGEINVLDPGAFGAVTITKSISIISERFEAGVLVSGTNAIVINAGANDSVILRGLDIEGLGTGLAGVKFLAGASLQLENSSIHGFRGTNGRGIDVALAASGKVLVTNTIVSDCAEGMRFNTTVGTLNVTLDHVNVTRSTGLGVVGVQSTITMNRSNVTNNSGAGIRTLGASTVINVSDSTISGNNIGVFASIAGSRIRLANSAIMNNTTGISFNAGAFVESGGNNQVAGNSASQAPNASYTPK